MRSIQPLLLFWNQLYKKHSFIPVSVSLGLKFVSAVTMPVWHILNLCLRMFVLVIACVIVITSTCIFLNIRSWYLCCITLWLLASLYSFTPVNYILEFSRISIVSLWGIFLSILKLHDTSGWNNILELNIRKNSNWIRKK